MQSIATRSAESNYEQIPSSCPTARTESGRLHSCFADYGMPGGASQMSEQKLGLLLIKVLQE
jgi:hypothetical protein